MMVGGCNRTSVELKRQYLSYPLQWSSAVIEPVWNWNKIAAAIAEANKVAVIEPVWNWNLPLQYSPKPIGNSCNRTSVELKRGRPYLSSLENRQAVIEPVWNWNELIQENQYYDYEAVIEPVWNWNKESLPVSCPKQSAVIEPVWNWNRLAVKSVTSVDAAVIEPVWNWNIEDPIGIKAERESCNRTSVELKPGNVRIYDSDILRL